MNNKKLTLYVEPLVYEHFIRKINERNYITSKIKGKITSVDDMINFFMKTYCDGRLSFPQPRDDDGNYLPLEFERDITIDYEQ